MSEWREDYEDDDYEDDFEDELSVHSKAQTPSVPNTHVSNTSSQTPLTAAVPVRGQVAGLTAVQHARLSLETSFESYQSSGDGQVFASSAHELSTPSSASASSHHSDPMYPAETSKRLVLQSHEGTYPTEAAAAPSPPSHQHQGPTYASSGGAPVLDSYETSLGDSPGRTTTTNSSRPRYETDEAELSYPQETGGGSAPTTAGAAATAGPHARGPYHRPASVSTSSSSVTHSEGSSTQGIHDALSQLQPPTVHLSVPRNPTSLESAGKQSGSDTPGSIQGTASAAMVATPNTRDVSGPRQTFLDEGNNNKKALHQSNYTTVEELDDEPLPQYKGRPPTMDDEELSAIEDEAVKSCDGSRHQLHESVKQQLPIPPPAPPKATPSRSSSSSASSSAAAPSETYSDTFTGTTPHHSSQPTPTPARSIPASSSSSAAASSTPKPTSSRGGYSEKETTPSRQHTHTSSLSNTPLPTAPERQGGTPTPDTSFTSDAKNLTAPYSGSRPQDILREATPASPPQPPPPSSSSSSPSSPTSSSESGRGDGEERATLLLRISELQAEITTWDNRIQRKREQIAAAEAAGGTPTATSPATARSPSSRAQRGGSGGGLRTSPRRSNSKVQPAAARRKVSGGWGRGAGGGRTGATGRAGSVDKGFPVTKARLEALQEKNAKLEAAYARLGGDGSGGAAGIDVPALVARAEVQLQKARARLKEVTAARRALENRDKRAAHTIEEVHKKMPSSTELQERQMNDGIYSRTGLQRTVQELRSNIDRTRAAIQLMEAKCAELSAQVQERHLSSITPKEYEALRSLRESKKKTVGKHRAAIAVYSAAAGGNGGNGGTSGQTSRTTSPRKSSLARRKASVQSNLTEAEQQAMEEYEASKAALLEDHQAALTQRKQELQSSIDDLWRRIQQRGEQIKANNGGGIAGDAVAGSGVAAARRPSLRQVLQTPAGGQRAKDGGDGGGRTSPARKSAVASAPSSSLQHSAARNSTAAERLRGAVAAARQNHRARSTESPASALQQHDVASTESSAKKESKPLPPSTTTSQRTVRGTPQPSSSSFTPLADSPMKGKVPWEAAASSATPSGTHGAPNSCTSPLDESVEEEGVVDVHAGGVDHQTTPAANEHVPLDDADGDGAIEAMLRKIDEDNKRIGDEVFGRASSQSPPHDEIIEEIGETEEHGNGGLRSAAAASLNDAEEMDDIPEEEVNDAGEDSGRSTPEWLREI
jgi:hypothetical protein